MFCLYLDFCYVFCYNKLLAAILLLLAFRQTFATFSYCYVTYYIASLLQF